jgi:hypothetical protein
LSASRINNGTDITGSGRVLADLANLTEPAVDSVTPFNLRGHELECNSAIDWYHGPPQFNRIA